jgi:hypothetical protein
MIKIEITGHSTVELADKMLGIAGSLLATDYRRIYAARQALEAKVEVAEAAPVDPTPAPKSAPVAEASESQPTTEEPSSTPAPAASVSEDEELEVVDLPIATLDFETVVRPLVLKVVEVRGKPVMEEMLSRFGVAKASMIEAALLPELVSLCNEALAK